MNRTRLPLYTTRKMTIFHFMQAALDSKQLPVSERSSQLKNTYDASKEASNQHLQVRVSGSSISLVS